jgi:hypothetical protein
MCGASDMIASGWRGRYCTHCHESAVFIVFHVSTSATLAARTHNAGLQVFKLESAYLVLLGLASLSRGLVAAQFASALHTQKRCSHLRH